METKILTEKLHQTESLIESIERRTHKNMKDIEATIQGLEKAESSVGKLKEKYAEVRKKRQGILAAGKDSSDLNKQIKNIRDELEIKEDEQIGLQARLEQLNSEKIQLENTERETKKEILRIKIQALVPRYNENALKLSEIVKELWDLKIKLNDHNNYAVASSMGWDGNALEKIPQLYVPGQGEEVDRYSFFYHYIYRQEKTKTLRGE